MWRSQLMTVTSIYELIAFFYFNVKFYKFYGDYKLGNWETGILN